MKGIGKLLCGEIIESGAAKSALGQLAASIDDFSGRSIKFLKNRATKETVSFGPFCARVFLENSCAALVGRMDSFRLIYLSEFQSQPQYEMGKRAKSSFSWAGDVMPENEPSELWSINNELPKIGRSLFSKHADHIFWKPAIGNMLDFIGSMDASRVPQDLLEMDPENYIVQTRGRCSQLYSTLSKSVHWEFFSSSMIFDEPTVKSLIKDTCVISGQLGLISHFVPTACARLPKRKAVEIYRNLWREVQ